MKTKVADQTEGTFGLTLQITKQCNFNCSYCYELDQHQEQHSELSQVQNILNFCRMIKETRNQIIDLTFIGGEPTLNPKFAKEILSALYNESLLNQCTLITNGWSSKSIIDFFPEEISKEYINVQISYDGYEINEKYRRMHGKSTTSKVLNTTKEILKLGYNVHLKSTLPIDALHLVPDILYEFDELSQKYNSNFLYNPTEDFTTTFSLDREFKDYKEYFDKYFSEVLRIETTRLQAGLNPLTRWFTDYRLETEQCRAGIDMVTINETGDIMYCQHVDWTQGAKKDLSYININEPLEAIRNRLAEVSQFNSNKIQEQQQDCAGCSALYCIKCPIINYSITKDYNTMHGKHAIPFMCEYYQNLSRFIYVYDKIKRTRSSDGISIS